MDQTPRIHTGTTHALLIGVDDYRSFNGTGELDLKGSRNDVVLLASYCVEVLGIPPGNIHVLTTPRLTPEELEQNASLRGVRWGSASGKEVTKRLASLLAVSKKGTALLAFSGHGAALPDVGPVLCLGDTAPDLKHGVLSLKTLGEDIKNAGAKDRLIALLDCCHVTSPSPVHPRLRGTALPHAVATADVASQGHLFRVSDRVLLAARPGKPAYQVRLGGLWHGALTFALVTAAERWQGENGISHGSYKHVLKMAKRTVKALGVPQNPELRVPEERWVAIRKSPFLGIKPGPTQREPDAVGQVGQLDPSQRDFCLYQIVQDGVIAAMLAVNHPAVINDKPYQANVEYWSIRGVLAAGKDCSIENKTASASGGGGTWPSPPKLPDGYPLAGQTGTLTTRSATPETWRPASAPGPGWYGMNRSGARVGLTWVDSIVTWYIASQGAPPNPTYILGANEPSLTLVHLAQAPGLGSDQTWYCADAPITPTPTGP